jgi:Transposase
MFFGMGTLAFVEWHPQGGSASREASNEGLGSSNPLDQWCLLKKARLPAWNQTPRFFHWWLPPALKLLADPVYENVTNLSPSEAKPPRCQLYTQNEKTDKEQRQANNPRGIAAARNPCGRHRYWGQRDLGSSAAGASGAAHPQIWRLYRRTAIVAWLQQCQIRTVAMESTGLYWIPLYQLLADAGLKLCLVNARHVKNVPGRKSDVRDCQWLQYLHSVGLLRASYRPQQAVCALRSIYRYRQNLITLCAQHVQHMQGALDQMNVKLHHVIDDLTGVTGLAHRRGDFGGSTRSTPSEPSIGILAFALPNRALPKPWRATGAANSSLC